MEPNNPPVQVTVTFNPVIASRRVTFGENAKVEFDNEAPGTVTFTLDVTTALQVRFPSNPIQWVRRIDKDADDGGPVDDHNLLPIDPPRGATVSRIDDNTTTVTIASDPNIEKQTFRFYVIVQTMDGRFFGSDPTIVTMRPGDGGT